jgi:uncharacterized protein (TIGR03086 family)
MSQDVIARATHLVNEFDARVQSAAPDAWANAAPCEGWTARDVAAHVSNNLLRLGKGLQGQPPTEVGADDDIVQAWNAARDSFLTGIANGDLSQEMPGPAGPMPAEHLIGRLICTDVLVHTWDLARATGGDEHLDAEAVTGAFSGMKQMDEMIRRPGVFGPKVEPAADADEQTRFLNFLGRSV